MQNRKIILLIPPQSEFSKDYLPSLGIGYIASSLEMSGYKVKIIDSHVENYDSNMTIKKILEENPLAVGVTSVTQNRFNAIEVIKKNSKRIYLFLLAGGIFIIHTILLLL